MPAICVQSALATPSKGAFSDPAFHGTPRVEKGGGGGVWTKGFIIRTDTETKGGKDISR